LKDLVGFTRQLATLVDAGMAFVSCLKALGKQQRRKAMKDIIYDLAARVETGDSFSDALTKHPKVFDQLYVCMVKAGEKSGMLAESLSRLALHLEGAARLRRKVKSAVMYPAVVTIVAIAVTIFLMVKVVPVFGDIYSSFKGKLPAPTEWLLNISNFIQHWFIIITLLAGAAIYGWFSYIKTKNGRMFWDSRRLKIPIFGHIAHSICLARFTRTFASLVNGGVPIISVLETVSKACGNVVMEKAVITCAVDIQNGNGISDALAKHEVFPELIVNMISAGEQTGKLDDMMKRIADHLDEEVETLLSGLTSLIEPIIIVVLSVIIGTIVICMFLPIFKLSDLVSH
jgi:type IV pilus assembly protein PilC